MLRLYASIPGLTGPGAAYLLDTVQQKSTGNLILEAVIAVVGLVSTLLSHRKVNKLVKQQKGNVQDTTIKESKNVVK